MTSFTPMTLEEGRARRKNSIVIGLVLLVLVVSFYIVTIVKLQGNVAKRMGMGGTTGSQQVPSPSNKATVSKKAGSGQDGK